MKNSLKYFSIIYVIIIFIIIILGWFFVQSLPIFVQRQVNPVLMLQPDNVNRDMDLPTIKGTISPPVDIYKLSIPSTELVDKGKGLYQSNCSGCHGTEGKGDGVAGVSLNPKPRNFTTTEGWTIGFKFTQLYKTLQEGITNRGMASYSSLPVEDRVALIHYISETFLKNYPKNTPEELKELDKNYSLSLGIKQPNQIPVKLAGEKIIADNKRTTDRIKTITSEVGKTSKDTAAILLKKYTSNLSKAIKVLSSDSSWNNNEKIFMDLISRNPVNNGFGSNIYAITPKETIVLYSYLKNLFTAFKN